MCGMWSSRRYLTHRLLVSLATLSGALCCCCVRAAVEACTQGVLGPLIICDRTKLLLLSDDQRPNNSSIFSRILLDFSPGSGDIPRLSSHEATHALDLAFF